MKTKKNKYYFKKMNEPGIEFDLHLLFLKMLAVPYIF